MASLSSDFNKDFRKLLNSKTRGFVSEKSRDIRNLLLSRILVGHHNCFPRFVLQSERNDCPPPFGSEYYRYVMPEIGRVNGERLFFEVVNKDMPSVNLHREKRGTRTSPPTIVDCDETAQLVEAILKHLDRAKLVKNEKPINVPKGFFVFEFTAHSGNRMKNKVVTVEPFQAKDLKKAIEILQLWPQGRSYQDLSDFKVCTSEGWTHLNHELKPHTLRWYAYLSDYKISPP